jgi:hypothetical protein
MKNILSWFVIIGSIVVVISFFWTERTHAPEMRPERVIPQPNISAGVAKNNISPTIEVTTPLQNTHIASPLTVSGKARGTWYFEASFPIELQKNNGTMIATTTGKAQGNWMTEDWVPFTATITFPAQPAGSLGKLILKKDNPSGEPQNDMSIVVPVEF